MPVQNAVLSGDHLMPDEEPPAADDLSALRLLALPDLGPPFDDDPAGRAIVTADIGTVGLGRGNRDAGATAATAAPSDAGAATAAPSDAGAATAATSDGGAGAAQARADSDWARQFALLLSEALGGARPVRQILPWTTERARLQLTRLMPLFRSGRRPRVLRVSKARNRNRGG